MSWMWTIISFFRAALYNAPLASLQTKGGQGCDSCHPWPSPFRRVLQRVQFGYPYRIVTRAIPGPRPLGTPTGASNFAVPQNCELFLGPKVIRAGEVLTQLIHLPLLRHDYLNACLLFNTSCQSADIRIGPFWMVMNRHELPYTSPHCNLCNCARV